MKTEHIILGITVVGLVGYAIYRHSRLSPIVNNVPEDKVTTLTPDQAKNASANIQSSGTNAVTQVGQADLNQVQNGYGHDITNPFGTDSEPEYDDTDPYGAYYDGG